MKSYFEWLKRRVVSAWTRSWKDFAPTRKHIGLYAGIYLVTCAILLFLAGADAAKQDAIKTLAKSVLGPLGAFVVYFLFNLWLSGFRLWEIGLKQDVQPAAGSGTESVHLANARRLEALIKEGQATRQHHRKPSFYMEVIDWRRRAEAAVASCGHEERAMFETLAPPNTRGAIYTDAYRARDLRILKDLVGKLRLVMARQYRLATEGVQKREMPNASD